MRVLIAGSNGGIGRALVHRYLEDGHQVWCLSHSEAASPPEGIEDSLATDWLKSPERVAKWLSKIAEKQGKPDAVISCTGFLHSQQKGPEKQLSDIDRDFLMQNMELNCYAHVVLSQCIEPLYRRNDRFCFAALSAMVGSITDNKLGGWYSYRMSKAALNMFIKTVSVEWQRRYPEATAVAVHPGTTDTPLSEPFQARIPDGKLYSTEKTAKRLAKVINHLSPEQSGDLLFWDGSKLDY